MNKLFSKVAALSVGLAMAIGVGVAVGSKSAKVVKAAESTVSMSSFSSISGSVDSDPYISYEARKGSAANDPVVNSGVIRVYQNGGEFEVNAATGASMTSVTITSSMATSVLVTTDGVAEGSNRSITANGSTTVSGVSASSVLFTCKGTDKNSRLYVKAISVTYESSGPVASYTISYNSNGGSGTMESSTGSNPEVAACTFTAPEGMQFSKWNTAANGSGDDYAAGDKPGKDLTLYAIWTEIPTPGPTTEATMTPGTNGSDAVVNVSGNAKTAIKVGTGSAGGDMSITVPAGATKLYFYAAAWKGVEDLSLDLTGATASPSSFNLSPDTGMTANSPFTLSGTESDFLFTTDLSDIAEETAVTLTTSVAKRFVIWGACYEIESGKSMGIKDENHIEGPFEVMYGDTSEFKHAVPWDLEEPATIKDASGLSWVVENESIIDYQFDSFGWLEYKPKAVGSTKVTVSYEGYKSASTTISVVPGTVSSLAISGSMSKTSYYVGESWSADGFAVSATYSSGYQAVVTADVEWSFNPTAPATSVKAVVATASFGGQTVSSSSQTVTVSRTNPLMTLYSLADSTAVDVYGVYVGYQEGSGPIIMDGAYGMLCYFGKYNPHDVSGYTEGETVLHVTGSMATYNELRQISSPTISVASGTYDAPETPVVYAAKGGETVEYSSRLTTVTGTAVCTKNDFSGDPGAKDITMSFTVGSNTIQVFYKTAAQSSDTAAYQAMKDAVANETEITVKGFTSWYNGFQVQMNGYVPPAESYTAEEFAQDLLDQTDAVCTGWKKGDDNHDAIEAIWSNLASNDKYPSLPKEQKDILAEAARDEEGTVVEQAMARYDFLTGKYDLSNFINGRTPIVPANGRYGDISSIASDNTMIIVITIASVSALAFTMLLVFKKKKQK